jgi:hypothetical protein
MALPANFLALLGQPGARTLYWIEIEGLPYAYGSRAQTSAFWSSLGAAMQFEALRPYLPEVPGGVDARLNPLDGIASPGEFQFKVVDVDGFLTQAANVGRDEEDPDALWLTADATAGAGTLNVGGNLSAWPTAGVGYCGRVTFRYTGKGGSTLTGVTWGIYRSQSVDLTAGSVLTMFPQHLGLRRCWFYLAMSANDTFAIGDRAARYAGLIEDYSLEDLTKYVLVVRTPEKELGESTTLFRGFRSGRLVSSLPGPQPGGALAPPTQQVEYKGSGEGDPGPSRDANGEIVLYLRRTDGNIDTPWVANEFVYLRIEDEIILGQWDATNTRLAHVQRGLNGTAVVEHAAPDGEWREGTFIVQQDSTGIPETRHSKFTQGDSPEAIILQLLASSGTYGVLPEAWNGGFDPVRIDVTSFETLRDTVHASDHLIAWIDEPVAFRDLIVEHLLKPFGLYLVHGPDDLVSAHYLRQGPPASTIATIDATQIVEQPKWQSGTPETVGEYRFECDIDPLGGLRGDPGTLFVDVFSDTRRLFGKRAQQLVHRSLFAHAAAGSVVPTGAYRMAQRAFDSRRAFFLARYSRPPPSLTVKVRWSLFHVVPGDVVTLTVPQLPSISGAGRSYSGPVDVTARKPIDAEAAVELELRLLGMALTRYGSVSPSAKVVSVVGADITIEAAFFAALDASHFTVGDKIVAVAAKFDTVSSVATITAITNPSGSIWKISTSPSLTPSAGDFLTWADYDSCTAAQRNATAAFLADANEQLGAANDAADRYSGM